VTGLISLRLEPQDPVAVEILASVRDMESVGCATLILDDIDEGVLLTLGDIVVEAEVVDIGLLRLAKALLDHPRFSSAFLDRMRLSPISWKEIHGWLR
jgi:hypothetical protein